MLHQVCWPAALSRNLALFKQVYFMIYSQYTLLTKKDVTIKINLHGKLKVHTLSFIDKQCGHQCHGGGDVCGTLSRIFTVVIYNPFYELLKKKEHFRGT